jgi:hypothetical protein
MGGLCRATLHRSDLPAGGPTGHQHGHQEADRKAENPAESNPCSAHGSILPNTGSVVNIEQVFDSISGAC